MLAFAMSQTAGKRDPLLRATHAEISSKSAAREKLEPFGVGMSTAGLHRSNVTVVGAMASRNDVRMNQRVGRGPREEREGGRWRRSACVRREDARG
eukprot:6208675-Pleurochrysis_carterae.AAC.2